MELTLLDKQVIWLEYKAFEADMYNGKSKEERDELQQFFTPADLTIQMLEALDETKEDFIESDVLDPTSGSGNLLSAALLIGAKANQLFGNEYDANMVDFCKQRITSIPARLLNAIINEDICDFVKNILNIAAIDAMAIYWLAITINDRLEEFRDWQVHQGNALIADCLTLFGPEYDDTILKELLKRRNGMKGGWMNNPDRYKEVEQLDLFENMF